jgi:hypothetical protein
MTVLKEPSRGSVDSEDLPQTLSAFPNRPFCDGHHIGLRIPRMEFVAAC